jgi:hypothetical protein
MSDTRITAPVRTRTRNTLTVNHIFRFNIGAEEVIEFHYHPPNSLASDLDVLLKDGRQSDMKMEAGGSSFPWHKIILSSRSDVLKAMFTHWELKECIDGKLVLEDDPETVKSLRSWPGWH